LPKYAFKRIALVPPVVTAEELRAIETALGVEFANHIQWNFWSSDTNVNAEDVSVLLEDASTVRGLSDFEIVADNGDSTITLSGGATGCWAEYEARPDLEHPTRIKVRAIEGVFRDRRRRTGFLPRPLCAAPGLNKLALSPAIKIGKPGFQLRPDWNEIFNKSAINIVSYAATFGVGLLIGWLL
jgi:hypothetical protein